MYQTSSPTPPRRRRIRGRKRRSNRSRISLSLELVLATGLTIAVAAGLIVAGGSGRPVEVVVLVAAAGFAIAFGWPTSGHAAVAACAVFLILETAFGRLDASHSGGLLLLSAGVLGAVVAAGFAHKGDGTERRREPVAEPTPDPWSADPWADEQPGARRLAAGTLEYEIERARRTDRPLSVLAIRPDELEFLAAAGTESLTHLLGLVGDAIEDTVRAIDVVERVGQAQFQVVLPDTGPEGARTVAERIRLQIDSTRPELTPGRPAGVTVSVGAASYPTDGGDEVSLAVAAGRALNRAAELGGNRTVLHSLPAGAPRGWAMTGAGGSPN